MSTKKRDSLKKMSLVLLKETLERENKILQKKVLLNKLKDKGESIKEFRDQIEEEIRYREDLENIQSCIGKLSINDQEKHVQKLCDFEKNPVKERYKPFLTLNNKMEVKPDSIIYKIMEDCKPNIKPTKLITLPESLDILKKQEERVKEEMVKIHFNKLLIQDDDVGSDSNSTDSEEHE